MNRKKILSFCLVSSIVLSLTACGSDVTTTRSGENTTNKVSDILQSQMNDGGKNTESPDESVSQAAVSGSASEGESEEENGISGVVDTDHIDVDLTELSSTMVYSEVFNIMSEPDQYVGKIIKMTGVAATYHDDNDGNDYYACIIQDATACCSQGIEYVLAKDKTYPKKDSEITVVGRFEPYKINDTQYYTLKDSMLIK